VVVTVHDQQDPRRWKAAGIDRRLGARFLARLPNVRWIAVSETVRGQLLARGICAKRIAVIPAFLAPAKEDSGPVALPRSLQDFLAAHEPVLSIYGSKYDFVDGLDLYGFDMAIEALASLKLDFPRSGLVVCVPGDFRREYQDQLRERAIRLGCLGEVLFLEEGLPDGSELWRRSSVHLRPTVTDGDSVAVREALGLGVAVVASDAVARPQGCILFPNRNLDSFVDGIKSALASPPQLRYDGDERSATHFRAILGEYQRAAGKSSVPEFQNSDE
jgi:glycosyltransferase involved in cell wall biosynthesis